jgi:hypothetical protein
MVDGFKTDLIWCSAHCHQSPTKGLLLSHGPSLTVVVPYPLRNPD